MTREEKVKNLLTELIDMIDNGSQRDLDRADEIGISIIKLFEQKSILDKIKAEIEKLEYLSMEDGSDGYDKYIEQSEVLNIIDKYKTDTEFNHESFYEFLLNVINPNEMEKYRSMFLSSGEIVN